MIIMVFETEDTGEYICSHGIDTDTLKVVPMYPGTFEYYIDQMYYDLNLEEWVLKDELP